MGQTWSENVGQIGFVSVSVVMIMGWTGRFHFKHVEHVPACRAESFLSVVDYSAGLDPGSRLVNAAGVCLQTELQTPAGSEGLPGLQQLKHIFMNQNEPLN